MGMLKAASNDGAPKTFVADDNVGSLTTDFSADDSDGAGLLGLDVAELGLSSE
jgi:hypothetical protein